MSVTTMNVYGVYDVYDVLDDVVFTNPSSKLKNNREFDFFTNRGENHINFSLLFFKSNQKQKKKERKKETSPTNNVLNGQRR